MMALAERFDRVKLMLILARVAPDEAAASAILAKLCLHVRIGARAAGTYVGQLAALAIAKVGTRTFLGGITFELEADEALAFRHEPGVSTLSQALELEGMIPASSANADLVIAIGSLGPATLHVFVDGAFAGVRRTDAHAQLGGSFAPAALYAASLAVGEAFQRRVYELTRGAAGQARAARRDIGLNLLEPDNPSAEVLLPENTALPGELWLLGCGNLGQAMAFALGVLRYREPSSVRLMLQDYDESVEANLSTSILTTTENLGLRKTRLVARYLEARGFKPRITEQRFGSCSHIAYDDPTLVYCGVDNYQARRALDAAGFSSIIDVGLGGQVSDCTTFRITTFPGSRTSAEWYASEPEPRKSDPDLANAFGDTADQCGVTTLLTATSVGIPYVGLVGASLALAQIIRRVNTGAWVALVDGDVHSGCRYLQPTSGPPVVHLVEHPTAV